MRSLAYLLLAISIATAVADDVNCWGSGMSAQGTACNAAVKRYDRLRVHTLLIAPGAVSQSGPTPSTALLSAVHFPNVDGQPPGKLSQLQFRGSFSQLTGCACPGGNCENLLKQCPCASGTCSVSDVATCAATWLGTAGFCSTTPPTTGLAQIADNTFLQMSFGATQATLSAGTNTLRNTSASADGAVGMPAWVFLNPNLTPSNPPVFNQRNYAFANNKALTALVNIDKGAFVSAEWNWDKADTRCKSNEAPGRKFYANDIVNPCGSNTANPCLNNLLCGVTFDYCLLSMMRTNTAANPGILTPECDLVISLAWQGTDANKRYCQSNNQMFSKFNAMGLNNLIQESLTKGNDITSDIEGKLKNGG